MLNQQCQSTEGINDTKTSKRKFKELAVSDERAYGHGEMQNTTCETAGWCREKWNLYILHYMQIFAQS